MTRTLINALKDHVEKEVTIQGWVDVARQQGKMAFFDFRDRTGKIQGVVFGKPEVLEIAQTLKTDYVVSVTGVIHERPEKMRNANVQNGDIELEITAIEILSAASPMPFDKDAELNLDTLLDYRPITLRRDHERAMFKVQAEILVAEQEIAVAEFAHTLAPRLLERQLPHHQHSQEVGRIFDIGVLGTL